MMLEKIVSCSSCKGFTVVIDALIEWLYWFKLVLQLVIDLIIEAKKLYNQEMRKILF